MLRLYVFCLLLIFGSVLAFRLLLTIGPHLHFEPPVSSLKH